MKIDDDLELVELNYNLLEEYFSAIHDKKDYSDEIRVRLQKKYPKQEILKTKIEEKGSPPHFAVLCDDKFVGIFEFCALTKEDFVEIEFWLFKEHRKKGIMTKILPNMITFAKNNFNKNKIMAVVPLGNVPAQHLLLKTGFKKSSGIIQEDKGNGKIEKEYVFFFPF